ncbi:prolyl oligopeptidase family serine peptidase [Solimicrobium silvestre]|uniref:Serine proteases of the peptidase family S9A n=1 Tax=Solimicrobium silvestre TaxID=2099400 RepID=A0A2S9GTU0_9BURK|nr:prolyl oligopeptidase family serine peptidase [Solimicrobium silvestre]PRC91145.1 Serine proteases of the peptidase family S9A [Solimicrobium silvestre]
MKKQIIHRFFYILLSVISVTSSASPSVAPSSNDPYLWLEDIDSVRSLKWVTQQNDITKDRLSSLPGYTDLYNDALKILTSTSRIPQVEQHGAYFYNLWQDQLHPRGLFRRTTLAELSKPDTQWELLIDIDALSKSEGKLWAFGDAIFLAPENKRCLISLSPGGGDASEIREFDVEAKQFVSDGFTLPAAKSHVSWRDADTLYVATDFGPGSLTKSGYPRIVKVWQRGTALANAPTLYEGDENSMTASAGVVKIHGEKQIDVLTENLTFWNSKVSLIVDGKLQPLALPATASIHGGYHGRLVIWLKEVWVVNGRTYPAGAVVLVDPHASLEKPGAIELVVAPDAHSNVIGVVTTPNGLLVSTLDDVRGRLNRYTLGTAGWEHVKVPFPDNGSLEVKSVDDDTGDAIVQFQTFLTPPSLYFVAADGKSINLLKQQAASFDGSNFEVTQHWTKSLDGTQIPYFVVASKNIKMDGKNPVWMFSYGGFENSLTPSYSGSYEDLHGAYGKLWLERGGVFVLANIRGGGEFGPTWHTSALKENHVKAFEDFEAVAADLSRSKLSSPVHIGIEGRSNGGLLVSATMLRHPELYGAVVCGNPLIDMQRYNKLLAGASWVGEYGDPDVPEQWGYISKYSPYQNLKSGMKLPHVMFYSTTRDDRVHPGHARKMAAKMEAMNYQIEYFENVEGGHHGPVVTEQLATRIARTYSFLWQHLQ